MKKISEKQRVKQALKSLFKSMDFLSTHYLDKKGLNKRESQFFFNIYQQLGMAWEFLGLQCKHWDGYRKLKDKQETCRICGKVKGAADSYYLLPREGAKRVGRHLKPNSKKTFEKLKEAQILSDTITFHGTSLKIDVHNSYKSKLLGDKHPINIAADRRVWLRERGIECHIDQHLVYIKMPRRNKQAGKQKYGGFPWELTKKDLKHFPVIFDYDEKNRFLGLTILS